MKPPAVRVMQLVLSCRSLSVPVPAAIATSAQFFHGPSPFAVAVMVIVPIGPGAVGPVPVYVQVNVPGAGIAGGALQVQFVPVAPLKVIPAGTTSVTVMALVPMKAAPILLTPRVYEKFEDPGCGMSATGTSTPVFTIATLTGLGGISTVLQSRLSFSVVSRRPEVGSTATVAQFSYLPGVFVVTVMTSGLRCAALLNRPGPKL